MTPESLVWYHQESWIRALGQSQGCLVEVEGKGGNLFILLCSEPQGRCQQFASPE